MSIVVNHLRESEIYCGKDILGNFILYPEINSLNNYKIEAVKKV